MIDTAMLQGKRILLIVAGGIAAYKTLELIRRLRDGGAQVRAILTEAGAQFVTPLSLASLTGDKVYTDLFSLTDESEMGHIRLSREADLVVVAPATADLLARMASGLSNDLATTALLATDKPVLVAPSMNARMWSHPATQRTLAQLDADGIQRIDPAHGDLACGEEGVGRMAEAAQIRDAIADFFASDERLKGVRALVTSGPTFEAIDPIRYIANRSSGKQGHAIADACARLGAEVTLVTGPTGEPDPRGVAVVRIQSAAEMIAACDRSLPVDVAFCAAAVSDWGVAEPRPNKIKKVDGEEPPALKLVANPDILAHIVDAGNRRPRLVVGFAAETDSVIDNAKAKLARKNCDWIVANDVSGGTIGGTDNRVHLVTQSGVEDWPRLDKREVARRLVNRAASVLAGQTQ